MSDVTILTVLKFLGLAIAFAAAIWGMTRNTSFDDEIGRKRLTKAGHVAVALALGSFIVAGTSQGFETLAKQSERRNAALDRAARAAEQETRDARAFRNEQRVRQNLDLTRLVQAEARVNASQERATLLEGRLLSLRVAAEQRARALALSQDVNNASRANLDQAGHVLSQTQRLLSPIRDLSLRITWRIPLGESMPELAALVRSLRVSNASAQVPGVLSADGTDESIRTITFDGRFPAYPTLERAPEVYSAIGSATGNFGFFAESIPSMSNYFNADVTDLADWRSRLAAGGAPRLTYLADLHSLVFETTMAPGAAVQTTGAIVSVVDLDRASLAFSISSEAPAGFGIAMARYRRLLDGLTPIHLTLTVSDRTYEANQEDFRRLGRRTFAAAFTQTSMTPQRRQRILDWVPPR